MISYDLAKKLKDAGFPSPLTRGTDAMYQPDLSELIEACVGFDQLLRNYSSDKKTVNWIARHYSSEAKSIEGRGSSPEIAVAELWLALNKK